MTAGSTSAQAVWTDSEDEGLTASSRSRSFSLVSHSSKSVSSHSSFSPSSTSSDGGSSIEAGHPEPPPSRAELAAYRSMLRDLERQEAAHVAKSGIPAVSGVSASERDDHEPIQSLEKTSDSTKLDHRWPLRLELLKDKSVPLERVVKTVARQIIADQQLSLRASIYNDNAADHQAGQNVDLNREVDGLEEDEETPLPSDLVKSTHIFVNKLLVNLAMMRPRASIKKQKHLPPISWDGVISAAMLVEGNEEVVCNAAKRVRGVLRSEDADAVDGYPRRSIYDAMDARLAYLDRKRSKRVPVSVDDVYAPVLPPSRKPKRVHLTEAQRKARDEKRAARLAKK